MTRNEYELRDDVQNELPALTLEDLQGHMSCAESCETLEDLKANIEAAKQTAEELAKELGALLLQLGGES